MKVILVLTELSAYGGTLRFLERVLEAHSRQGIETLLLAPEGETPVLLSALVARHGVPLVRAAARKSATTPPLLTPYFDFLYCRDVVRSSRPDLVLVSCADPGRMSIALYLPCPVVYALHSVPETRFRLPARLYLWLGSHLDNRVLTVSDASARQIARTMGIPRSRIAVVYNSTPSAERSQAPAKAPLVLTAGHLVDYKDPGLWLEVARIVLEKHPGASFAWLGDGPLLEELRQRVRELSLEEKVHLPGYIPDPSGWFARASVYLQPSLRESHGIAVLEAMAHGLPCVVSDAGGLPESVQDGVTGYICPVRDVKRFAGRTLELIADRVLARRLGAAGAQRVEREFSPRVQEEKLMDLYRDLVNREPR